MKPHLKPHAFQPGNPGGPGRPKNLIDRGHVREIISRFAWLSREELQAKIKDPKTPMMEIIVASIMVKAAQGGDATRFETLMNRSIGKVQDVVEESRRAIKTTIYPDGTEERIEYAAPEALSPAEGE